MGRDDDEGVDINKFMMMMVVVMTMATITKKLSRDDEVTLNNVNAKKKKTYQIYMHVAMNIHIHYLMNSRIHLICINLVI